MNGSLLVSGIVEQLPPGTPVSGGLAGDGDRFRSTLISADCEPRP